ncbi:MAG TPA: hypothetical protein PKW95_08205 [bacterium]|nr:hypothetical protein [bacterium]
MLRHGKLLAPWAVIALCLVLVFSCYHGDDDDNNDGKEEENPPGDDDDSSSGPTTVDDDTVGPTPTDDDTNDDDTTDDDTGDDDVTDDDTSQEPTITGIEHGTCKDGSGPAKTEWPESLVLTYASNVLTVKHVNGVFNCCLDSIEVAMELDGFIIELYEEEYAPEPCFCVCPFDVTTHIANLAAGEYTVKVYVNGAFSIDGQVTIE